MEWTCSDCDVRLKKEQRADHAINTGHDVHSKGKLVNYMYPVRLRPIKSYMHIEQYPKTRKALDLLKKLTEGI